MIGNGQYQSLSTLTNPPNDASAVGARLSKLGFTLIGKDGTPADGPLMNLDEDTFTTA
jgi:uncharacterized caspase-like protein